MPNSKLLAQEHDSIKILVKTLIGLNIPQATITTILRQDDHLSAAETKKYINYKTAESITEERGQIIPRFFFFHAKMVKNIYLGVVNESLH